MHSPLNSILHLNILQEVDSTNNYAMARINERGVMTGTAWLALHQTSGKGQRGKLWQSKPGENILLSIAIKPDGLLLTDQFMLSSSVALGSYDFVKNYAGRETSIKWSNDIYINDKKAGGILIENIIRGNDWMYSVAGIGINLNQEKFSPDLPNPVSLYQVTGKKFELLKMAEDLHHCVMNRISHLHSQKHSQIIEEYNSRLYHRGKKQQFFSKEGRFQAIIKRVEKDGKLILEKDGKLIGINFGEVSFII
ncbi:MAG: biotin--[acetyl-CoA-carboxylase] ligase [Chitinophagaceae bacterium]